MLVGNYKIDLAAENVIVTSVTFQKGIKSKFYIVVVVIFIPKAFLLPSVRWKEFRGTDQKTLNNDLSRDRGLRLFP